MKKSIWTKGVGTIAVLGAFLVAPLVCQAQTVAKPAKANQARFGLNLAVAEFGGDIPGIYGRTYTYPDATDLDYYKAQGRTLIRFPFRWERMQHSLNAPLHTAELGYLKAFLKAAGERKMDVIIDVHNYGRYQFQGEPVENMQIIGTERVPYSAFANLWSQLATALHNEPGLHGYGLMNEPHDMGNWERWPLAAQAAIDAIRKVDKKTAIYVAGDAWSGATNWRKGGNETLNEKVRDPQNNLVFEAHCYFDSDLSGSYKKSYDEDQRTADTGVENVRPFVEWCKEKGVRGFVGEFGVPDKDPRWLVTMDRFLAYLNANNVGATYWAAGPWWGDYTLSIEPKRPSAEDAAKGPLAKGVERTLDRPQMLILRQYPG